MRNYVIALYIRLSVEDFKTESLSIPNQKLILREKAMSLPEWDNSEILEFIDNGHTGTNFERPAVQELLTIACGLCIHYSRHISNVHSITCFLSASINPTLQELVHFAPVLSGTFITFPSSKQDVRNYSSFYTRIDPLTSIKCTSRQHVLPVRAGFAQMSNVW